MAILFGNKLYWFASQCEYVFFFFLNIFYTNTQLSYAVTLLLFNYVFQKLSLLHWQCEWRRYLLFFRNSFFFVYRHSDLEVSCSNGAKTRHGEYRCCLRTVAGHDIWHWAARFETFTERNCWAYDACAGEVWTEGGFTLALFQGCGTRSEELLEQAQLNFSFVNWTVILLMTVLAQ
jgi:hypothetical protein